MANLRDIINAATPGPWYFEESEHTQQMFAENRIGGSLVHPTQMMKAPKQSDVFAPYWLTEADKRHIAAYSPDHALLIEAVIDGAKRLTDALYDPDTTDVTFVSLPMARLTAYRKDRGYE